jgi:hypothetical protein
LQASPQPASGAKRLHTPVAQASADQLGQQIAVFDDEDLTIDGGFPSIDSPKPRNSFKRPVNLTQAVICNIRNENDTDDLKRGARDDGGLSGNLWPRCYIYPSPAD